VPPGAARNRRVLPQDFARVRASSSHSTLAIDNRAAADPVDARVDSDDPPDMMAAAADAPQYSASLAAITTSAPTRSNFAKCPQLRHGFSQAPHCSNVKIRLQSCFMLTTVQLFCFASSYSAWVKVPTLVSGNPWAGP
jgi:hypothetical protein